MYMWGRQQPTNGARDCGDVTAADDDSHHCVGHTDLAAQLRDRGDD